LIFFFKGFSKEVPDSWEFEEYFRRGEKLLLCAIQRRNISTSLVLVTTPVIVAAAVTPMKKHIISLNQCEYVTLTSSITRKEIQTQDFFVSGISYGVPCIGVFYTLDYLNRIPCQFVNVY
jgi:hypothetical protein